MTLGAALAGLVALLVGAAGWLLLPGSGVPALRSPRGGPLRGVPRRGPARRPPGLRRLLGGVRPPGDGPPAVRVARAASEVAALLRAGAAAASAWSPQRLDGEPGGPSAPGPPGRPTDTVSLALDAAARAAAAGADPAAALRRQAARAGGSAAGRGSPLLSLALAWRTSEVTGAPAAAVLDALAAALRDEAAAADVRDAALAGPRATARLLLALPGLGLAASTAVGADPVGVLLGTSAGRWCGALGLASALAGWLWTSALVRAAARAS